MPPASRSMTLACRSLPTERTKSRTLVFPWSTWPRTETIGWRLWPRSTVTSSGESCSVSSMPSPQTP